MSHTVKQVVMTHLQQHSKKPDEVRQRILELCGNETSKLELFARQTYDGWDSYGDEL